MDYLNLTAEERQEIDKIYAKKADERTEDEKIIIAGYEATFTAWETYSKAIQEEKEKTNELATAYYSQLADDAQTKYEEKIKTILGENYVLGD